MTPRGMSAAEKNAYVLRGNRRVRVAHRINARTSPRGWNNARTAEGGAVDGGCQCDQGRTTGLVGAPNDDDSVAADTTIVALHALCGMDTAAAAQQCAAHSQAGAEGSGVLAGSAAPWPPTSA